MLTQIFDDHNKLDLLEHFISLNGALHYGMPANTQKIKLGKQTEPIKFSKYLNLGKKKIKIFRPNFDVFWEIL